MEKETKSIEIRPYDKAWRVDNTLYRIGNITLPRGLPLRGIGFFIMSLFAIGVLTMLIPPLTVIPGILRNFMFPLFLAFFLMRQKMDGMAPHTFFFYALRYLATKGQCLERFKAYPLSYHSKAKMRWYCGRSRSTGGDDL